MLGWHRSVARRTGERIGCVGGAEAAAGWAAKTIESRLMDKKRQKQNLVNICPDFNIPVVEDTKKRWMAAELARNLLQYTDDEEE